MKLTKEGFPLDDNRDDAIFHELYSRVSEKLIAQESTLGNILVEMHRLINDDESGYESVEDFLIYAVNVTPRSNNV